MGRTKQISDEAVLAAARAVFAEQGFGASTREIARRAGISEAVLYQRHKTKVDLFFAAMIPPPLEPPNPSRRSGLRAELGALAVHVMGHFRLAMPVLLQLVSHPSFNLAEHAEHAGHRSLHGLGQMVAECLDRHWAQGRIAGGSARVHTAMLTFLATLHSLALFERMGIHGGAFPDAAVRDIVDLLVAGLAPRKGARA